MFTASIIAKRAPATIQARGRSYRSRVHIVTKRPEAIVAKVQGTRLYTTSIFKDSKGGYEDDCDCPYGATCKHTIALAYVIEGNDELRTLLDITEKPTVQEAEVVRELTQNQTSLLPILDWLDQLNKIKKQPVTSQSEKKNEGVYYQFTVDFDRHWNRRTSDEQFLAVTAGRYTYNRNYNRFNFGTTTSPESLLQRNPGYLTDIDRKILQILSYCSDNRSFYSYSDYNTVRLDIFALETLWPLMQNLPHVIFADKSVLRFFPKPVKFSLNSSMAEEGLSWQPQLLQDNKNVLEGKIIQVFTYDPLVILSNKHVLYQVENLHTSSLLEKILEFKTIPKNDLDTPEVIAKLIQATSYAPLTLPQQWTEQAEVKPGKPVVLLDTKADQWQIDLFFQYGNYQFSADDTTTLFVMEENGKTSICKRNADKELESLQTFKQMMQIPSSAPLPTTLSVKQQQDFFTKLLYDFPQEWDILLTDETEPVQREKQDFTIEQTSGIDWLELSGNIQMNEEHVPLFEILEQFRYDRPLVKVNNRLHLLDKKTLKKLETLQSLYNPKEKQIKLHRTHLGVLDSLHGIVDKKKLDVTWRQSLQALRAFKDIEDITLPKTLHAELRPYQKEGVNWLHFLRKFHFGGILADDMGLGKTLQTLTVLAQTHEGKNKKKLSLIVAPTSVVYNWQSEIEKFTPTLKSCVYVGKNRKLPKAAKTDVMITSYALLWRDRELLARQQFQYVILDEAQYIKNHAAKTAQAARSLQAEHRLSLTGTPVENNLLELWSQFAFVQPGMFGSKEDFTNTFLTPIEKYQSLPARKKLQQLLKPFILRRTKEQVMKELPPKIEQTIWCDMDEKQAKLYQIFKSYYQARVAKLIDMQGIEKSQVQILEALLRLRQICCHPKLLKLQEKQSFIRLPKDLQNVTNSAKLDAAMEVIETAIGEKHKLLIFSQFVEMLSILEAELHKRHILYVLLTGQTKNRQYVIKQFQETNRYPVFLLSLKAGGTGLNLTSADYVMHYDPWWNPAVEMQATDRAHRIGQMKTVSVYKMMVRNSIEEKIQELQNRKKDLIDNLIGANTGSKRLTKEDIAFLFSH